MSDVVELFPSSKPSARAYEPRPRSGLVGSRKNMHTFTFRSRSLILGASEADLIRDVRRDTDKAENKLKAIQARLKGVQERAANEVRELTRASKKLGAAIEAAKKQPDACMSGAEFAEYYATLPLDAQLAVSECLRQLSRQSS